MYSETQKELEMIVKETVDILENKNTDVEEWLDAALDVHRYFVDASGVCMGAEINVSLGGPNIVVNTEEERVYGSWGGDRCDSSYVDNIGLDDKVEEMYDMMRSAYR